MEIRVNLIELISNWTKEAKNEYDYESSDSESKIVQDFKLSILETDTTDLIKQRIASYLFNLLTKSDKNWKNKSRCRFCFNDTVAMDNDFIQCETCERVYKYEPRYSQIPLPSPDYLFLSTNDDNSPLELLAGMSYDTIINGDSFINYTSSDFNRTIDKTKTINVYFYPDIYVLLSQISNPLVYKLYTEDYWPKIRFDAFINQTDFTVEGNYLNQLSKQIDASTSAIQEFQKLTPYDIKDLETGFSRVIISQDNQDVSLDLLKIFHLYDVSDETPFLSLDGVNKLHKNLNFELVETWTIKVKGLVIRSRIKSGIYYSLVITPSGYVKCFIPVEYSPELRQGLVSTIIVSANKILKKIGIPLFETEYYNWGTGSSLTQFNSFNVQYSFVAENYDMNQIATLSKCLNMFMVLNSSDESNLSFVYTFDNQNNQSVRYDRWLKDKIYRTMKYAMRMTIIEYTEAIDNLQKEFGEYFDLSDLQLKIVFEQWLKNNKDILENLRTNGVLPSFFQSTIDGAIVRISVLNGQYRVYIQGIKTWKQETDLLLFIRRLLGLRQEINTNTFFKKYCLINKNMEPIKKKKKVPLREELHNALPGLYWKGFARQCQSKEQPTIFTNKRDYEEYIKKQNTNKGPVPKLEKIFTINAPDLTDDELNKELNTYILPLSGDKRKKSLRLQQHLMETETYSGEEIVRIATRLMLPISNNVKNIENINQYLKIQEFLIKEGTSWVYPNPKTFVVKKGEQDYYLTCPDDDKKKVSKYMGFLPIEDHPDAKTVDGNEKRKFCVPCCRGTIDNSRTSFCSAVIPYDEYLDSQNVEHTSYIKNERKFPLEENRYGYLPELLHELLNGNIEKYKRIDNIKENMFIRSGIYQSNFSFIQAIKIALKLPGSMEDILATLRNNITDKIFRSLNNGNLYWQFNQSIEQYRNHLTPGNIEPIDFQSLWEYCSLPGILIPEGFNIMIFETIETDIHIVCPQDQELNVFFDKSLKSVLLYHDTARFEPIMQITNDNIIRGLHAFDNKDTYEALQEWYNDSCEIIGNERKITAKTMIQKYKDQFLKQVYNQYNKVEYLITRDRVLIPCFPSGMSLKLPAISDILLPKYLKDYTTTLETAKKYFTKVDTVDTRVIFVEDTLSIPFINSIKPVYDTFSINEAILNDTPQKELTKVQKNLVEAELYERFRFNLANHMSKSNGSLRTFINTINKVDTLDYNAMYPIPNIRVLQPLSLTKELLDNFTERVTDELENNKMRANEILTNTVNQIIDRNDFSQPNDYTIYIKN